MSADIKDFTSYLEQKRAKEVAEQDAVKQVAVDTALHVEHVTQDPEWNIYLQKLKVHVDRMQAHREDCLVKVVQPAPAEVHQAIMCEYWKTQGFLQALELAMTLPKTLLSETRGRA